jgi:hypothetical protein
VPRAELRRQLANAFMDGLGRLAVVSQPRDAAADLGQNLPTGILERVACSKRACGVRWSGPGGEPHRHAYSIAYFSGGCFTATATPAFAQVHDYTIDTAAGSPLQTLQGLSC